jgi:hypothetical protein
MSNLVGFTPERALSANITASAGARARFFETGTTTPVVVRDVDGNVLAQPVLANAAGVFPQVTYTGTVAVKAVVTASDESALYTLDPCPLAPIGGSGASQITFTPATGISSTNVQAAIVEVQNNITANTANITTLVQTGGSGNAYTLSAAQTITAYAAGQMFLIRVNHENTGAATLNVDGLGARDLQKYSGTSLVALDSADLRIGDTVPVVYDGTRFVVVFAYSGIVQNAVAAAQAAAFARDVGHSQTWQTVTGSRTHSTSYQNTTGRPITVYIRAQASTSRAVQASADNVNWVEVGVAISGDVSSTTFIVPPNHFYRISGATTSIDSWTELR